MFKTDIPIVYKCAYRVIRSIQYKEKWVAYCVKNRKVCPSGIAPLYIYQSKIVKSTNTDINID